MPDNKTLLANQPQRCGSVAARLLLLCGVCLLGICLLWRSNLASAQEAPSPRPTPLPTHTRLCALGAIELPIYQPTWSEVHPLARVSELIALGQEIEAFESLTRILTELEGGLLLKPAHDLTSDWLRVPSPDEVLREWIQQHPAALPWQSLATSKGSSTKPSTKLWPADPIFWLPAAFDRGALDRHGNVFDHAVESGDWRLALQLLAAPTAGRAGSRLATASFELRSFLRQSAQRTASESRFRSTFPVAQPNAAPPLRELQLENRIELLDRGLATLLHQDLAPELPDPDRLVRCSTRRLPRGENYPLTDHRQVVVELGSRILAIDLDRGARVRWEYELPKNSGSRRADLLTRCSRPSILGDTILTLLRTRAPQHPIHLAGDLASRIGPSLAWDEAQRVAWTQPVRLTPPNLDAPFTQTPSAVHVSRDALTQALASVTQHADLAAPPLVVDDRVHLLLTQGLHCVRFELVTLDRQRGEVLWRRFLGNENFRQISESDIRGSTRRCELLASGGDLLVFTDAGWCARVDGRTGGFRGLLRYPRYSLEDTPRRKSAFGGPSRCWNVISPRMRYLGPVIAGYEHQVIVLPGDSKHVLALDTHHWKVDWASPELSKQCALLGRVGNQLVLLDCAIKRGQHEMTLLILNAGDGTIARAHRLELTARSPESPTAPLLVGVPRLHGAQDRAPEVWIPTQAGIEIWPLLARQAKASRVVPWPENSAGGTPILVGQEQVLSVGGKPVVVSQRRIFTITRPDPELNRPARIEIFTFR